MAALSATTDVLATVAGPTAVPGTTSSREEYPSCLADRSVQLPVANQRRMAQVARWLVTYPYRESDGALQQNAPVRGRSAISPWWGNEAAVSLLTAGKTLGATSYGRPVFCQTAGRWLDWVLEEVNRPGTGAVPEEAGGISEWEVHGPTETRRTLTTTDAAAASTLTLAWLYLRATGDTAFFDRWRLGRLDQVAGYLDRLLRPVAGTDAFLARASPTSHALYTADNVVVWAGYRDYASLLSALAAAPSANPGIAPALAAAAHRAASQSGRVERGIEDALWSPASDGYRWAAGEPAGWSTLYPEAIAQIFPAAWGANGGRSLLPEMTPVRRQLVLAGFARAAGGLGWITRAPSDAPHIEGALAALRTPGTPGVARAEALVVQARLEACLPGAGRAAPRGFLPIEGQLCAGGSIAPRWNIGDAAWYLRTLGYAAGQAILSGDARLQRPSGGTSRLVRFIPTLPAGGRYQVFVVPALARGRLAVAVRSQTGLWRRTVEASPSPRRPQPALVGSYRLRAGWHAGATGNWLQLSTTSGVPVQAVAFVRTG